MNEFIFGITLCEVPGEVKPGDIERLKELGINWVRLHFSWRDIEKEKGKFDFSFYDEVISKIKENGISILAGIGCGYSLMIPPWVLEEQKDKLNLLSYIPQVSRFVHEVVEHFKDKIDIWQAENEINHTSFHVLNNWREKSWVLNPIGELSVLVGIISSIKSTSFQSRVVINLEVDNPNWYSYLKLFIKNGLPFDIIGLDFYPCYSPIFSPLDVIYSEPSRILKLREIINEAEKFKRDIIVVETGYPAPNGCYTLENQAAYIHQACQVVLSSKAKGIFLWEFADQSSKGPEFPEHYFGLLNQKQERKPSFETYREEILQVKQTIIVSVKGLLFKEPKPGIYVYINNQLVGYTNIFGLFISKVLPEGELKIKIKGFFPWQRRKREIRLDQGRPQFIEFFV